jgi:hypothetical protein
VNFYLLPDVFDKSNVIKYLYLSIVYNFHYRINSLPIMSFFSYSF